MNVILSLMLAVMAAAYPLTPLHASVCQTNQKLSITIEELAKRAGVNNFISKLNPLGATGWEVTNITGYPILFASFKRQK